MLQRSLSASSKSLPQDPSNMQNYSQCISAIQELCNRHAQVNLYPTGRVLRRCVYCLENITKSSDETMRCGCQELFIHRECYLNFWEGLVQTLQSSKQPKIQQLQFIEDSLINTGQQFSGSYLANELVPIFIQECENRLNKCAEERKNSENLSWGIADSLTCPLCQQCQQDNFKLEQAAVNKTCSYCKESTFPNSYLDYYCTCVGDARIHADCLYKLLQQNKFQPMRICCPLEKCTENNIPVKEFSEFLYNQLYNCFVCSSRSMQFCYSVKWQDMVFLECGHQTCTSCFKGYLLRISKSKGADLLDGQYYPCVCDYCEVKISPEIVRTFFLSKIGNELFKQINNLLDSSFLNKIVTYKCPGFFRIKNQGQANEEKLSSEKDTQMRRDALEDKDAKEQFQKKQNKWLNEGYQIIECGNIFETDFTNIDSRILKCSKCNFRDCKNTKCKSPHFSSSCENFQLIKDFIKNPIAKGEAHEMYKMKQDGKEIYVTYDFVQKSQANGDKIDFIKEELPNQFFKDCKLPLILFDFNFNNEWTIKHANDNAKLYRGRIANVPIQYNYPKLPKLQGYGINIEYLYKLKKEDNKWISKRSDDDDTWISGYHGTSSIAAVTGIIKNGFQPGGGQAHAGGNCHFRVGQKVGIGVYFGSNVNVALGYARAIQIQNERYQIIFQCRLNPNTVKTPHQVNTDGAFYIINDPKDIRIIRILLIKQ